MRVCQRACCYLQAQTTTPINRDASAYSSNRSTLPASPVLVSSGLSLTLLTDGSGAALTPSKVILAERETKMNLLSLADRNTLYHADVECAKVG